MSDSHLKSMLPAGTYTGKTVLITGGGTGLGKSIATYLASLGANIVITGRRAEVLEQTAKEISEATGAQVLGVAGDVRNIEDVERVLAESIAKFGSVDVLLNNAAGNFVSPTERLSHRAFESVIGIVLQGTVNFTLTLGKYWIQEKIKGNILNITTTYAFT
ncbi:MAG TPA: SDR family NAD(P)-dependent oxidoreductase, partial [Saprospiraceae bacterium]|nr:SDR family NAD(P)-dependent oxidoreductase [Saprospiraceae bacterium]